MTGTNPICKGCMKSPHELEEFQQMAEVMEMTPATYVEIHEDTFDPQTRRFFCTPCWERAGMPFRTAEGIRLLAGRPAYKK